MMPASTLSHLSIDYDLANRFLAWLDEEAEFFTFQVFDDDRDRKDHRMAKIYSGSLDHVWGDLEGKQQDGCGVFVTINQTDGHGRKLANIVRVRAIWAECDHGMPEAWPLEPHGIVESSPGKFHVYWQVDGLGREDFSGVMARMVQDWGSDPNAKDLARVLRLPGFWHLKDPAAPFQVRIVSLDECLPYSAEAILKAFPPLIAPQPLAGDAGSSPIPQADGSVHKALVSELASKAAKRTHEMPTLGRHAMVLWLGRECAHRGLPVEVCDDALRIFAELMRPCDTSGVISGLNVEHEAKAFCDAHAKGLTDPEEKRRNSMPRPITVLPSVVSDVSVAGFDEEGGGAAFTPPPSFADLDERPEIVVGGDRLIGAMQEAERVLFEDKAAPYYVRGGILTRITERTQMGSQGEPIEGVTTLEPVSPPWLRARMMRSCKFVSVKQKDGEFIRYAVNLPKDYPESYCSWSTSDWWAPNLRAVVEAPVLFRNGQILSKPGYHAESGLLLASDIKWRLPPKRKPGSAIHPASDEAIEEASQIFRDLFWGPKRFSPATPEDYSAMVAAVLTTLVKTECGAAPGTVVTAPIWGSSKGKFVDVVSIVKCGRRAPLMTMPCDRRGQADEGKLEDMLFAAMLDGSGLMFIDEVQRQLHSSTLRGLITSETYRARIKGVSKMAEVRPIDNQWIIAGNNLVVSADDSRRWLRVYLDPQTDQPHKRVFDRDCLVHAHENRVDIVWAALTLMHSYIHAGMPDMGVRLGSFERWAALVPSCLVWAGFANPIDTMQAWQEADPERMRLGALTEAWQAYMGRTSITAKALCAELNQGPPALPQRAGGNTEMESLRSVLDDICGDIKGLNSRLLGGYLSVRKNRRVGLLRFVEDGKYQGAVKWRVESDSRESS
jgi:hypothetical protein